MTITGVVVVSRPVEISGHQADCVKAVLLAQGAAELNARNFGNGIPLICGLKHPSEQAFLWKVVAQQTGEMQLLPRNNRRLTP